MQHSNHAFLWFWVACICFCENQEGTVMTLRQTHTTSNACLLSLGLWQIQVLQHMLSSVGIRLSFFPGHATMKFQGFLVTPFWIRPISIGYKSTSSRRIYRLRSLPVGHPSRVYEIPWKTSESTIFLSQILGLLVLGAPVKVDRNERCPQGQQKIWAQPLLSSNDPIQGVFRHLGIWRLDLAPQHPGDVVVPRCACHRTSWKPHGMSDCRRFIPRPVQMVYVPTWMVDFYGKCR